MRDPSIKSYSPPMSLDQPVYNFAVVEVIKSELKDYAVGDHLYGVFRE